MATLAIKQLQIDKKIATAIEELEAKYNFTFTIYDDICEEDDLCYIVRNYWFSLYKKGSFNAYTNQYDIDTASIFIGLSSAGDKVGSAGVNQLYTSAEGVKGYKSVNGILKQIARIDNWLEDNLDSYSRNEADISVEVS